MSQDQTTGRRLDDLRRNYINLTTKCTNASERLRFLRICRSQKLIPRTMVISFNYNNDPKAHSIIQQAMLKLVKNACRNTFRSFNTSKVAVIKMGRLIFQLSTEHPNFHSEVSSIFTSIKKRRNKLRKIARRKYNKKLNLLMLNQFNFNHNFRNSRPGNINNNNPIQSINNFPVQTAGTPGSNYNLVGTISHPNNNNAPRQMNAGFLNLSSLVLGKDTVGLLNKGIKHCIKLREPLLEHVVADCESAISGLDNQTKDLIRHQLIPVVRGYSPTMPNKKQVSEIKILKSLKQEPNIITAKADKEPLIVILNKDDYISKMNSFIAETKCSVITKDPTDSTRTKLLKLSTDKSLPIEFRQGIRPHQCVYAPTIYGNVKTHKPTMDLRPIVARYSAPTYNAEKTVTKLYDRFIQDHIFSIRSTQQLVDELRDFVMPFNHSVYTVDVKSLYPSTPFFHSLQLFRSKLIRENRATMEQIISIMSVLYLIQDYNIFEFDGKMYRQHCGVPMGSPISGYLSELFLQDMESAILPEYASYIRLWRRYVDDILIIAHNDLNVAEILDKFTAKHDTIKFTHQLETDNVNYLDLNINFTANHKPIINIFRKPYDTICLFPKSTCTSRSIKWGAIRSHFLRAIRYISLPCDQENEIILIKNRAVQNGYCLPEINRILQQAFKIVNKSINPDEPKQPINFRKFKSSKLNFKIAKILKPYGIATVTDCSNSLGTLANNTKIHDFRLLSGVYAIPVKLQTSTVAYYIGRTLSTFNHRIHQHKNDIANKNINSSSLAYFTVIEGAAPLWDLATIVHPTCTLTRSRILETWAQISEAQTINIHIELNLISPWLCAITDNKFINHYNRIKQYQENIQTSTK